MSQDIIPFDFDEKLPAELRDLQTDDDSWGSGQTGGFPVISVKSKVFTIVRGEERELVTRPDDPDEPASKLELVVLRANKGVAKTYYESQYEEGSNEKPLCYSNDGVAPAADSEEPQAKKCSICPHNQWGSRVTDSGKKGKACSDLKRLAVASPTQVNDPMLLRVTPSSLKHWDRYVDQLRKRGVNPSMVVTQVKFNHEVSHQELLFKPVGFIQGETAAQIKAEREADLVANIIGAGPAAVPSDAPVPETTSQPKQEAKPEKKAKPEPAEEKPAKSKPEPVKDSGPDLDLDLDDEPKPEAKPEKKAKPAPEPETAGDDIDNELDDVLGDLDFDD